MHQLFIATGILVGLLTLAVGYRSFRPFRLRRFTIFLGLCGLLGCFHLINNGHVLGAPRAIVVVLPSDLADSKDLEEVCKALRWFDSVTFVAIDVSDTLSAGDAGEDLVWQTVGERGSDAIFQDVLSSLSNVTTNCPYFKFLNVKNDDWVPTVFGLQASTRSRLSLVFLHDSSATWKQLKIDDDFAVQLQNLLEAIDGSRSRTDAFLYDGSGSYDLNGLRIEVAPNRYPSVALKDLPGSFKLRLYLDDPTHRRKNARYRLTLKMDGTNVAVDGEDGTIEDTDVGTTRLVQFQMATIVSSDAILTPGFHRLDAEIEMPEGGVYRASTYFEVSAQNLLMIGTPNSLLVNEFFQDDVGLSATTHLGVCKIGRPGGKPCPRHRCEPKDLLDEWISNRNQAAGEYFRSDLLRNEVKTVEFPIADKSKFIEQLDQSTAVLLIEPSLKQLSEIESVVREQTPDRSMDARIHNGLVLGIIGPPEVPTDVDESEVPRWLIAERVHESKLHNDTVQILFCFDQSPYLRNHHFGSTKASEFQSKVANAICNLLRTRPEPDSREGTAKPITKLDSGHLVSECESPVFGRLPNTAIDAVVPPPFFVRVASPLSPLDAYSEGPQGSGSAGERGTAWETAGGQLGLRIGLLFEAQEIDESQLADFKHVFLSDNVAYGNTHVVIFTTKDLRYTKDVLSSYELAVHSANGLLQVDDDVAKSSKRLSDLTDAGIVPHFVYLDGFDVGDDCGNTIVNAINYDSKQFKLNTETQNQETTAYEYGGDSVKGNQEHIANQIVQNLKRQVVQQKRTARRFLSGRVQDERTPSQILSPARYYQIKKRGLGSKTYSGTGPMPPASGKPLLVACRRGEGAIIAFAYSPFAADVWYPDAATDSKRAAEILSRRSLSDDRKKDKLIEIGVAESEATRILSDNRTLSRLRDRHGWGLQRILDLRDLTALPMARSSRQPTIIRIENSPDDTFMKALARCDFATRELFPPVLIEKNAGDEREVGAVEITSASANDQSLVMRVSSGKPIQSVAGETEHFLKMGENSRVPIFVSLKGTGSTARSMRDALLQFVTAFGGQAISKETAKKKLSFTVSVRQLTASLLMVACFLLFAPVNQLRRWFAGREQATQRIPPRYPQFEIDAITNEWGANPGKPTATRSAGAPAGSRLFLAGDSLAVATAADMIGFTDLGKRIGIPPKSPRMKLRRSSRALSMRIVVDCCRSIGFPERSGESAKLPLVSAVTQFLIASAWHSGGVATLQSYQNHERTWGPVGASGDKEPAVQFLLDALGEGAEFSLRSKNVVDWLPGELVILISDGLALDPQSCSQLAARAVSDSTSLRVVIVRDRLTRFDVGLVQSAMTGKVLDRREWEPEELQFQLDSHLEQIRTSLESHGALFAKLETDLSAIDVFDRLKNGGLLQ